MIAQYFIILALCYGAMSAPQEQALPAGYVQVPNAGAYKYHETPSTFDEAEKKCVEEGGHLFVVRNESEKKYFERENLLKNLETGFWVGVRDKNHNGEWKTVLDQPLPFAAWGIDYLGNLQPDNKVGQYCAAFKIYGMGTAGCDDARSFYCEAIRA